MPPALAKPQPRGLPSQPARACSRMHPGCHSHHTCILGVGGWAGGSRHTGERPALRTESPWRTSNTEAEVTLQVKEPEPWVMPDGLCSLAPEAAGETPTPSKTREGKLNKVTFWALRTPVSLEQKRLYAFRPPLEGPRPEPSHWLSKAPQETAFSATTLSPVPSSGQDCKQAV